MVIEFKTLDMDDHTLQVNITPDGVISPYSPDET